MSLLEFPPGGKTIIGYILPEKKAKIAEDDDSNSEDEEEETQPEFLDMKEMNSLTSGGQMFNVSIPTRNEVEIMEMRSKKSHRVEGRFSLKDPWWEVTCHTHKARGKLVLRGYPAYRLCSDLHGAEGRAILSLFLTACNVHPSFISLFFDWLETEREVGFSNLMAVLTEFEQGEHHKAAAQQIKSMLNVSVAGKRVQAASLFPNVMRYVPTLLPGHFTGLLGKGKAKSKQARSTQTPTQSTQTPTQSTQTPTQLEEDNSDEEAVDLTILAKLEEIIKSDVWKLGFNHVMHKELKVVRCEAQLRSFRDCGLLKELPVKHRNALEVYDALKNLCFRTGSTYSELAALCEEVRRNSVSLGEVEVWDAVYFMKEIGVVVCERRRVALWNLHSYETGIAKCLGRLVQAEPWVIPLDATEVLTAAAQERLSKKENAEEGLEHRGDIAPDAEQLPSGMNTRRETGGTAAWFINSNTVSGNVPGTSHTAMVDTYIKPEPDVTHATSDPANVDQKPPPAVQLDPDQVRAAEMICSNPLTVISGKGGCGKTTVVCLVFKAALQQQLKKDKEEVINACCDFENDCENGSEVWGEAVPCPGLHPDGNVKMEGGASKSSVLTGEDEVLLTAPTGRAASLLSKRTCFQAYTLHQVLWSFMHAKKDANGVPEDWKFAHVRVLVVDEGSLVCVQLLNSVLTMLIEHAQLRKFVILGDVRQLPSIQPGNTLYDLFYSLGPWAIEMKTNHRAESQLIVDNAGLISEMGLKTTSFRQLEYDAILDLNDSYTIPSEDKRFILILLPNTNGTEDYDLKVAIELLLKAAPGLKDDTRSQFIAFRRTECALINELCCKHYCNHCTKNSKNRIEFQPGDKVCCTKNGYLTDQNKKASPEQGPGEPDRTRVQERERVRENGATKRNETRDKKNFKEQDKERLCNGEIFFITDDKTEEEIGSARRRKERYMTLDDRDGRTLCVSYREIQKECKLQHAWARTIHTFQGSETETVVYVLGNGSVQTWKHVYTAVTRGQKRVYVIAKREGMESAIRRRIIPRNTRLGTLAKKLRSQPGPGGLDHPEGSQPEPGTPLKPDPGLGPTQSTPQTPPRRFFADSLVSHYRPLNGTFRVPPTPTLAIPAPSNCVQAQSNPVLPRPPWRTHPSTARQADATDTCLMEDNPFSQAFARSAMDSSSQKQSEGWCGEQGITMETRSTRNDGQMGGASDDFSPSKRALSPDSVELNLTPLKQHKMEPVESPLGCSVLEQLSLRTRNRTSSSKQLFRDPAR